MAHVSPDVRSLRDDISALRGDVHRHPELAWNERRTAERITSFLKASGLELRTGLGGTGVLAEAKGDSSRTLLLRVDMDALPIQEDSRSPHASEVPGVMHACGHDGHVAMGAAAARLAAGRRAPVNVRVLFQPAEEGEGGAQAMVAAGAMDGVAVAVGVHLWNELPVGTIGVKAGPLMAGLQRPRLVVRGRGRPRRKPHPFPHPAVAGAP